MFQLWSLSFQSQQPKPQRTDDMAAELIPGQITWNDLTVPDAESVRSFYESVVGWTSSPVAMGDYSDYSMMDAAGNVVAGVCHAKGENAKIPPAWLMYVTVADVVECVARCQAMGGTVIDGPRPAGGAKIAVIKDPVGAVLALYEPELISNGDKTSDGNRSSSEVSGNGE
jgi:predicted enzyme related to lactoylglutathione lyase